MGGNDTPDIERLRAHLDKLASPCGCKSGAALTLVALVGWPVKALTDGVALTPRGLLTALATYVLVVLAAAIVGKVAGIVVGRLRRRWYQRRLTARLAVAVAVAPMRG